MGDRLGIPGAVSLFTSLQAQQRVLWNQGRRQHAGAGLFTQLSHRTFGFKVQSAAFKSLLHLPFSIYINYPQAH